MHHWLFEWTEKIIQLYFIDRGLITLQDETVPLTSTRLPKFRKANFKYFINPRNF